MHANECNVDHIMQYIVSNFARCFVSFQGVGKN
jgi:hypothetical protein